MKKLFILSGAAVLALAGAAVAQPPGGPDGPGRDRNADLTRAQVIERTDRMFARLDANHDGRFTPDEAQARREQRRQQMAERLFDRLDLDRNGSITREEARQAHTRHRAEQDAQGPGGPGGRGMRHRGMRHAGPGGPGRHGGPDMRGRRLFGEQGFVTAEQFRTRALARFDRIDADRNGVVTAAERQAAREQRRERRAGHRRPG